MSLSLEKFHQKDYFTPEILELQSKCVEGKADVRSSDLSRLRSILQASNSTDLPVLEGKNINIAPSFQRNIAMAIMQILSIQRMVQIDPKNFSEMFAKLFAALSVEMFKLEEVDKKLARQNRIRKGIIEKSEKGKKMGK